MVCGGCCEGGELEDLVDKLIKIILFLHIEKNSSLISFDNIIR